VKILRLAVCFSAVAFAQNPRAAMEESLKRQRESIEKQRAAVRTHVESAVRTQVQDAFFTTLWTSPPVPFVAPAPVSPCDPVPPERIGEIVSEISKREGLTPDLLRAVIEKESSYLPCAVSVSGAQGLMQLMPETAAELGVQNPFDPQENVSGGARYLKQLLVKYDGNLPLALAAYNAGPGRVDAVGTVPEIPETMNYVAKILGQLGTQ
jgi:soluble lytic murein transglycosylase-like protein